jgi:cytochrome c oxidase assembly protein subunit 17
MSASAASTSTAKPAAAAPAAATAPAASCPVPSAPANGLRICCACPETRVPRDECVVRFGEENCGDYIEAHKVCLRAQGFKV